MNAAVLLLLYLVVLLAMAWPLAKWIVYVVDGKFASVARFERMLFRVMGVRVGDEQSWVRYAITLVMFNALGLIAVYALQRFQAGLPLNPQAFPAVSADSAFNTAISFVTNTNWQGYGGESTMSYFTQMLALTVQNFLSAATGIVVAIALIRGFSRRAAATLGNAWVDLTRVVLWILLPLSFAFAIVLSSQGVIQNFDNYKSVTTVEPVTWQTAVTDSQGVAQKTAAGEPLMKDESSATQLIAMGPVASQLAIKMIGTNGGGFFNANSAHPFENPTALTNFEQMLAIFLIPAALCFVLGLMVGDVRQGIALLLTMTLVFVAAVALTTYFEQAGNPMLSVMGGDTAASLTQAGGNMEGKEVRFGIDASALFAVITTAASCGAVNAMHDSFTALGGAVPLAMIQLGEVIFGGVGSGLYGMIVFALLAVFIAGLMIGRTPEYLGKKIEVFEMKMVSLAVLIVPLVVLGGTALALLTDAGRAGIQDAGPHGFTEVLYAMSSAANNNGSAFAGLSANTVFYNVLLGAAMWLGRFGIIIPVLALAGALAAKQRLPESEGTLPTHGLLFVFLLIAIVLLVGLLNYVPALALGPIAEHLSAIVR